MFGHDLSPISGGHMQRKYRFWKIIVDMFSVDASLGVCLSPADKNAGLEHPRGGGCVVFMLN